MVLQTAQLPQDDRISISKKEYLADIDVCMGGRVAEELSLFSYYAGSFCCLTVAFSVYGSDNVTSGASSDLRRATSVAQSMVRVSVSHN